MSIVEKAIWLITGKSTLRITEYYQIAFNLLVGNAISEIAPKELSDYEKGLLKNLRLRIYDKRRKALKGILKKNKISKEDGILDIHEKLF